MASGWEAVEAVLFVVNFIGRRRLSPAKSAMGLRPWPAFRSTRFRVGGTMLGAATSFEILRLVIDDLNAAGDPNGVAAAMTAHPEFAHLGALGPAIGDFLTPPFPDVAPFPEDYKTLWRRVFHVIGRKDPPGLYYVLKELKEILDAVGTVADAEDCEALVDLRDQGIEDRVAEITASFAAAIGVVQSEALAIAGLIESLKPAVTTDNPGDPVPPPADWAPREFLHWNLTGKFVKRLFNSADQTGDTRLRAYALGYLVSYASLVCGAGHINSIVGAPPRTQWWRQRFVANYVDTWVFGFYNQNPRPIFAGDDPTPDYDSGSWPNLCGSNLQQRFELGGIDPEELMDLAARGREMPVIVPADFAANWFQAAQDTFPDMPQGLTAEALNEAYLFNWLVLWFRTSGAVLGCNQTPPMVPPDGCDDAPSELDPFVNGVPIDGNIPQPPAPNIDADVDLAAVICGIILAILGGILVLGGSVALGGAAIGGAIALLDCDSATDIKWKEIRCLIFWERMYLHNALVGIHRLLALAALDYPYAKELALDSDYQDLFPFLEAWETGKNLTKSKVKIEYPGKAWDGSLLTFNKPPTTFERPQTIAFRDAAYPNFIVDDPTNPLVAGGAANKDPVGIWPDGGPYKADGEVPARFGNAVRNAVALLNIAGKELPDWNLDADRGLASLNWRFKAGYDPDNVQIVPAI